MSDPFRLGLWSVGAVLLALCCLGPVLLVSSGGVVLAAVAGYFGYAWVALPILLAGLVAYFLWRRAKPRGCNVEGNHQ